MSEITPAGSTGHEEAHAVGKSDVSVLNAPLVPPSQHVGAATAPVQAEEKVPQEPAEKRTLYVENLPYNASEEQVGTHFSQLGPVDRCHLEVTPDGRSKGRAFVTFQTSALAKHAITTFHGASFDGMQLKVVQAVSSEIPPAFNSSEHVDVVVSELPLSFKEEDVKALFAAFGNVLSTKLLLTREGRSRGVAYIRFSTEDEAEKAIEALSGSVPPGATKPLACKFVKERSQEEYYGAAPYTRTEPAQHWSSTTTSYDPYQGQQRGGYASEQRREPAPQPSRDYERPRDTRETRAFPQTNLYIANLPRQFGETDVEELFNPFGEIVGVRVLYDREGASRGLAFVRFTTEESANAAITQLDSTVPREGEAPILVKLAKPEHQRVPAHIRDRVRGGGRGGDHGRRGPIRRREQRAPAPRYCGGGYSGGGGGGYRGRQGSGRYDYSERGYEYQPQPHHQTQYAAETQYAAAADYGAADSSYYAMYGETEPRSQQYEQRDPRSQQYEQPRDARSQHQYEGRSQEREPRSQAQHYEAQQRDPRSQQFERDPRSQQYEQHSYDRDPRVQQQYEQQRDPRSQQYDQYQQYAQRDPRQYEQHGDTQQRGYRQW